MVKGKLFQSFRVTTEKAQSPSDLQLEERGTDKSNWSQDHSDLEAVYSIIRSQI